MRVIVPIYSSNSLANMDDETLCYASSTWVLEWNWRPIRNKPHGRSTETDAARVSPILAAHLQSLTERFRRKTGSLIP
jgi:hypothetical protein